MDENLEFLLKKEPMFPPLGGSYALFLFLEHSMEITIGKLGQFEFPVGSYVYMGSAHGSGGLRARLSHHIAVTHKPHWHIDYFRSFAEVVGIWYVVGGKSFECVWSQKLKNHNQYRAVVPGFGASDCRNGCSSHLWWLGVDRVVLGESLVIE